MFIFAPSMRKRICLNTFCKSLFFLSKRPRIFKKTKQEKNKPEQHVYDYVVGLGLFLFRFLRGHRG